MRYSVLLEPDEDGWIVATCPALPGCVSQGRDRAEAIANIREAIELTVEVRRDLGLPLSADSVEIDIAA